MRRLAWITALASCASASPELRNDAPPVRYHIRVDRPDDVDRDCNLLGGERPDIGVVIAEHLRNELHGEKITEVAIRRGAVDLVGTCTDVDRLETEKVKNGETVIAIDPRSNVGAFVVAQLLNRSHFCARVESDTIVISKRWVEICTPGAR